MLDSAVETVRLPFEGREIVEAGDVADVKYVIKIAGRDPQTREGALVRVEKAQFAFSGLPHSCGSEGGEVGNLLAHRVAAGGVGVRGFNAAVRAARARS